MQDFRIGVARRVDLVAEARELGTGEQPLVAGALVSQVLFQPQVGKGQHVALQRSLLQPQRLGHPAHGPAAGQHQHESDPDVALVITPLLCACRNTRRSLAVKCTCMGQV